MRRLLLNAVLLLAFPLVSTAAEFKTTSPARAGFSPERFERVQAVINRYVEENGIPGIVTVIARDGRVIHRSAVGQMGADNETAISEDSLFRILSMTKAVTAVAALILYEEGHFQLYDPVAKYLPAYENMQIWQDGKLVPAERTMTIHHLFTHMSGLSYGFPEGHPALEQIDPEDLRTSGSLVEFANRLAAYPLHFEPGTDWEYSYSTDVLGAIVEKISGQTLGEFFEQRIFAPLDMKDTGFAVPANKLDRLTTVHTWNRDTEQMEIVSGQPFDGPYRQLPIDMGGAGLISTARDYLRFLEMLRQGGALGKTRVLGPKTVAFMLSDHLPKSLVENNIGPDADLGLGLGGSHALGIGIYADPVRRGVLSTAGELEWGGAAGTIYWWDPVEQITVVSMLQLYRSPWQLRFRDDLSVAIYQALMEMRGE